MPGTQQELNGTKRYINWKNIFKLNNKTFTFKIPKEFIQFNSREINNLIYYKSAPVTMDLKKANNYKY